MRSFIELLCCVILVPQLLFVVCDLVFFDGSRWCTGFGCLVCQRCVGVDTPKFAIYMYCFGRES